MAKTLFLLSLSDMDRLGIYLNNLTNSLVTSTGYTILVVQQFGHLCLLWDTLLQLFITESFAYNLCFLTNVELQHLYYCFSYLSVVRL